MKYNFRIISPKEDLIYGHKGTRFRVFQSLEYTIHECEMIFFIYCETSNLWGESIRDQKFEGMDKMTKGILKAKELF